MTRIKSRSPSPSGADEEMGGFDLYTPDTLRLIGSISTPTNPRKRSSTTNSASPHPKRAYTASSAASRASRTPGASAGSKKKKASQVKAPAKQARVKAPTIVFGIDFGTSYSGIAYAHCSDGKTIYVMMSWDDTNEDYVKIPSAIEFMPQGDVWGIDAKYRPDALRWLKLTLVNQPDLDVKVRNSIHIQAARDGLQALGKSPVQAISAYLKHIWEHCIDKLKVAEGEEIVDTSRFDVTFTIPAIWPNYARKLMEEAVQQAGILKRRPAGRTVHRFVSEPEAAALATLSGLETRHNIEVGDIFVGVDCGGGTVDVISHEITNPEPMTVKEVVEGKGECDLCGAMFLDDGFKALLHRKLQDISPEAMEDVTEEEIQEIMSRNWENEIRSQFTGADKTWTIRVPYSLIDADVLDHTNGYPTFRISSVEIEEVFRPIMEKIYSLVNRQIQAVIKKKGRAPKSVILVGGFGSSKYVREYLKRRCHGVEILQRRGDQPWSAISRGAVIHGLTKLKIDTPFSVEVGSRIARASYGAICEEIWDEDVHYPQNKSFDGILRKDVSINVMKWLVVQGQDIYVDRHPSFNFTKFLSEPPKQIETDIFMSLAEVPPARKDESVRKVFKLTWDIQFDWESLDVFVNDEGKTFRKLEYTVEMKCSAGATVFSIYHGGYKQAGKNVALEVYDTADV